MLKVKVEGIYESDIGSGQKKFINFDYTFELSRPNEAGVITHVLRRFLPLLIAQDKAKQENPCSRIKTFVITDIQKTEEQSKLIGKNILDLTAWEIQDLACMFDLFKIPLHGKHSITELRERAVLAYAEKVLKVPMKEPKDKAMCTFLKQQADGTYKLDVNGSDRELFKVYVPDGYFEKEEKQKAEKKSFAYFLKQAGIEVANTVLTATGNEPIKDQNDGENENDKGGQGGGFPSITDLIKGNKNK